LPWVFPYAGPSEAPVGEIENYLPGRPVCPTVLFSSPYTDGSRVIWGASTRFHVFTANPNGQQLRYIDYLTTAEMKGDPMTDEMVVSLGEMKAPALADLMGQSFPQEESESGAQPGMSGVQYLLDKDGIFYQPRGTVVYAYGDKVEGDRFLPIELKRTYEVPAEKLTRDDDFLYGVVMTYDGMLMFYSAFGTVGIIDHSFDPAIVLCVDEKSQIQALDRTQPVLPLKKGRCGTMPHDYKRNGTTCLFAALNALEGKVAGQCYARHRHQEFLKFLRKLDREFPKDMPLRLIVDNYGTHNHHKVQEWL
jgi:hypothetical protein